jgi:5-methylcytosine-specific restriction endonuclease McrA
MKPVSQIPVLVLNKTWNPIRVSNVEHAIGRASAGRLSILDPENYIPYSWEDWQELPLFGDQKFIVTGRNRKTGEPLKIRLPSIVVTSAYNKLPNFKVKYNIKNIWLRDGGRCQYTGRKLSLSEVTKDHVIPTSKGGPDNWSNVVACCPHVNKKKADKSLAELGWKLLKQPKEPKWSPLFSALYSVSQIPADWIPYLKDMPKADTDIYEAASRLANS